MLSEWLTTNLADAVAWKLAQAGVTQPLLVQAGPGEIEVAKQAGGPPPPWMDPLRVWAVFILCFVFSVIGVAVSFAVFGKAISGSRAWGVALVVSVVMLSISYGAKYSNAEARKAFTPIDVLQYLSQGILWPSTWPALADLVGIQRVAPPSHTQLLHSLENIFPVSAAFFM